MKKFSILACVCCMVLVGCSTKEEPSYDETLILSKTEEIIQYIDEGKYEDVLANTVEEMASLTPEKLQGAIDSLGEKGAFVSFDEHEMVVQKGIAVMGIVVSYEQKKVQYTISFDEDLKLAGLYVKPL